MTTPQKGLANSDMLKSQFPGKPVGYLQSVVNLP